MLFGLSEVRMRREMSYGVNVRASLLIDTLYFAGGPDGLDALYVSNTHVSVPSATTSVCV
jgi:hypothetical protein